MALILEQDTKSLVYESFGEIEYGKNNPSYKRLNETKYSVNDEINYLAKEQLTEDV